MLPKRIIPTKPGAEPGLVLAAPPPEIGAAIIVSVAERMHIAAENLDDRQLRGRELFMAAQRSNGIAMLFSETETWWMSTKGNRVWKVFVNIRNHRGVRAAEYRCSCSDFEKNGRVDCLHIFAEKMRRGHVIVDGEPEAKRVKEATGGRREARKRYGVGGLTVKTLQKHARMTLADRLPELVVDIKRMIDRENVATTHRDKHLSSRATALVLKAVFGLSADEMMPVYRRLIDEGVLRLKKPPHANTLSRWMNDPRLTPVLERMLTLTAKPFRAIERAAMVDSSKMSQMRSAHSRWVEYGDDERDGADWMKMHAIVGVETLVCMGVIFSGVLGAGTHDKHFIVRLVDKALGVFGLTYVLADKAYLAEDVVGLLWERGIRACIPLKKNSDPKTKKRWFEAYQHLAEWFDKRQPVFHEAYRVRVKIECFFSLVKRVAEGYCWSRGRPHRDAEGKLRYGGNATAPSTAWQNETLAKVIYVNMRLTNEHEVRTGYRMNYLTDTFFPEYAEEDRLIA